ncbi:transposase, IS4 family, partial [Oesophagostomum dentatum]
VCRAIVSKRDIFVKWPTNEERRFISDRFQELTGIPGIVGAIDGSHFRIQGPHVDEFVYINRKGYHSLNIGLIADSSRKFRWFSRAYPGSAHDSRVFRESHLYAGLLRRQHMGILLGDSAYRSEFFLLKPVLDAARGTREARYTDAVCRGRVIVENAIGVLKRQFHALHGELRYQPEKAATLISAAICLRNAAIDMGEPNFAGNDDEEADRHGAR